jgi:hypothetical protein
MEIGCIGTYPPEPFVKESQKVAIEAWRYIKGRENKTKHSLGGPVVELPKRAFQMAG